MTASKTKEAEAENALGDFGNFDGPSGSSSTLPPPPFDDNPASVGHPLIDFSESIPAPGGEEPPPEFTPYEAEYFEVGYGDIVSHDPHLNTDGEALYRFLLSQAATAPSYRLHCRGAHTETRTRWVTHERNGRYESRSETYTESITDFDFYIDVGQHIVASPVHWSVADSEPAYRGLMVRQVEPPEGKRKATNKEIKAFKEWLKERAARGFPPWVSSTSGWREGIPDETNVLKSSKTLRQWADDYCASKKYLKEFAYEKVIYGWNIQQLESAIRSTIAASLYSGNVHVEFKASKSKVYIRSNNWLSRTLSNKWLKFLSFVLLLYPFIWLFKRFHSRGGGHWEVCGGAYALKRQAPSEDDTLLNFSDSSQRVSQTPAGTSRIVGLKEGEWFRQWEGTIVRAVYNRYQSTTPLFTPTAVAIAPLLDGY